jgi:hypothetical protein
MTRRRPTPWDWPDQPLKDLKLPMPTSANGRTAEYDVDPLFLERWSPRAFTGEAMPDGELMTLFDAARWAPSAFNGQPWRFVYAHRETGRAHV